MKVARLPVNEQERLKSLNEFFLLDSLPDGDFINFTKLASEICGGDTNCGLVDIDRHWSKFAVGTPSSTLLNDLVFGPGSSNKDLIIVPDTKSESDYAGKDSVIENPGVRFFARIPLFTEQKKVIGALCILGVKPLNLCDEQVLALKTLATQVVRHLYLLKKISDLNQLQIEQKSAYADLEKFSFVASHDLRSPLNNIISLTQILKEDFAEQLNEEGRDYINFLNNAANQLADLVSGILEYSRSSQILVDNKEEIIMPELIGEVKKLLNAPDHILVKYDVNDHKIRASKIALKQILLNLCDNAIKHNDKAEGLINVRFEDGPRFYTFEVADNGPGIPKQDQKRVFELFERANNNHSRAIEGIGVGLSIVKRLVEKSGGEIRVVSEPGKGTSFIFTIQK